MSDPVREHITQLRDEVEKRYQEGLAAIRNLEQNLLGGAPAPGSAAPQQDGRGTYISQTIPKPSVLLSSDTSQVDVVLAALKKSPQTVSELSAAVPSMDERQIRAVLYSKRVGQLVRKKRTNRGLVFSLPTKENTAAAKSSFKPGSAASTILGLIAARESGMSAAEVAAALKGKIDKGNTISSALYNLTRKSKRIRYDVAQKRYFLASSNAETPQH